MTETQLERGRLTSGERLAVAADLKTRYEAGATVRQLVAETGRAYGSVSALLHLADTQMRSASWPLNALTGDERAAARKTAVRMYEAGHTIRCAAEVLGRSWSCTRTLLIEAHTQFRSRNTRCTAQH
ncbi:helix-turn-helix domain-containing protein [Streptomyces monashensis]|jgi:hypothetical protein|uniref:helix-turn-helix domain-containing protein n=1 Tax=Streptomyces monashensis TaxID=1678012 RepID=UPI00340E1973